MKEDYQVVSTVTTRKRHCCEQCGTQIAIGENSVRVVGRFFGDAYKHHIHIECEAAAKAYAKLHRLYGEDWPWFQHQDDEPDDWRWMLEKHPIVAKRLGWDKRLKEWETDDDEPEAPAITSQESKNAG